MLHTADSVRTMISYPWRTGAYRSSRSARYARPYLGGKRCIPNEAGVHVSSTRRGLWPAGEEGVAEHLKASCVVLAGRAAEGIDRVTDMNAGEAGVFQHLPPARTGQPASYSTGPQVDVAQGPGRDGPAVGDVGELQPPPA
jgi:hypothetical protein